MLPFGLLVMDWWFGDASFDSFAASACQRQRKALIGLVIIRVRVLNGISWHHGEPGGRGLNLWSFMSHFDDWLLRMSMA